MNPAEQGYLPGQEWERSVSRYTWYLRASNRLVSQLMTKYHTINKALRRYAAEIHRITISIEAETEGVSRQRQNTRNAFTPSEKDIAIQPAL